MKIIYSTIFAVILLLPSSSFGKITEMQKIIQERMKASQLNLIPDSAGTTPSYWCTWSLQGYAASQDKTSSAFGISGHSLISEKLTEDLIFGKGGAAWSYDKIRADLFIVYDLGWDIPPGVDFGKEPWEKNSLILSDKKFPDCTGTPAERLIKLNKMTKNAGWKGAGFWVAAEPFEYGKNGKKQSLEETKRFFGQRAAWFNEAGIQYWKVDYGAFKGNIDFRRDITDAAKKNAPDLFLENCNVDGPLNDEGCPWCSVKVNNTGRFKNWDDGTILRNALAMISFSPVYRTYDVSPLISTTTTLDRVAALLEYYDYPKPGGLINCEDEPYLGAALGCGLGIMKHPNFSEEKKFDEVIRAVRWQRIAPAFPVKANETKVDTTILTDEYIFKEGETWADWIYGKLTKQSAPARVARGMSLPVVSGNELPYVICSKNPSGAVSIATLPRLDVEKGQYFPITDVTLYLTKREKPGAVGVFGRYKSLTISFETGKSINKIFAQDLAGDKAIDITDLIEIKGNTIKLSGELLILVGLSAATKNDLSEPGLCLFIK